MSKIPTDLRRSLTWDQGKEMAGRLQITAATGMSVYFCQPRSPADNLQDRFPHLRLALWRLVRRRCGQPRILRRREIWPGESSLDHGGIRSGRTRQSLIAGSSVLWPRPCDLIGVSKPADFAGVDLK